MILGLAAALKKHASSIHECSALGPDTEIFLAGTTAAHILHHVYHNSKYRDFILICQGKNDKLSI
jgi:hypothetical protein